MNIFIYKMVQLSGCLKVECSKKQASSNDRSFEFQHYSDFGR